MTLKRFLRTPTALIVGAILVFIVLTSLLSSHDSNKASLTEIQSQIVAGNVQSAKLLDKEQRIEIKTKDGRKLQSSFVDGYGQQLTALLTKSDVTAFETKVSKENIFVSLLFSFLPIGLVLILFLFMMNQMQGGGNRVMNFGKSKAKLVSKDTPKTTFADVAGVDEAIEELQEIKEFLQEPAKFQAVGAKIPKGVLLYGPPGTGKTLLARAVAGEAGVPFYSISGSDFVEMFVGVGASRVRDLFEQAKANAPAIVFVDEIDAVGRHRGAGLGGGLDEREQTLNQMLVEMDGFDVKGGVIMIAATNRPDILDPALLRPGRFDRQIAVDRPDLRGREQILNVHSKGKPMGPDVDIDVIARRTPGFTGADLANVINEGALLTARTGAKQITTKILEEAIDRVIAGPQRRTRVMGDHERLVTAYHECGHALVAASLPNISPVHKVTILPRGRALGYTMVLPIEDRYSQTRAEMLDTLAFALGGRAAEELVFHDVTSGASDDIQKVSAMARAMVTQYGMSTKLGSVRYGEEQGEVFLGMQQGNNRNYSEAVATVIDEEVRKIVETAHQEAFDILVQERKTLDLMVTELMREETLGKDELAVLFKNLKKRPMRKPMHLGTSRPPSKIPPVKYVDAAPNEFAHPGASNGSASNGTPRKTAKAAPTKKAPARRSGTATGPKA